MMKYLEVKASVQEPVECILKRIQKACYAAGYLGIGLKFALLYNSSRLARVEAMIRAADLVTAIDPAAVELRLLLCMCGRLHPREVSQEDLRALHNQCLIVESLGEEPEAVKRRATSANMIAK